MAWLEAELDMLEAAPPSPARTEAIRALAGRLPELAAHAQELRRAEVIRLRQVELLSLGKTAEQVGISKARADQIERAEKLKEARNGEPADRAQ